MTTVRALQLILGIALGGAAFSGYLSWRELSAGAVACAPVGPEDSILGYPPCVYGLAMYTALVILAGWGLWAGRRAAPG